MVQIKLVPKIDLINFQNVKMSFFYNYSVRFVNYYPH